MSKYANKIAHDLYETLYKNFPYSSLSRNYKKFKSHTRDIALGENNIMPLGNGSYYFEIGNDNAEKNTPAYHILEDAEVIYYGHRKKREFIDGKWQPVGKSRKWGTTTSKGSQDKIEDLKARDYGKWSKSKGKKTTYFQEYRRNNRGYRSRREQAKLENTNYYYNTHYRYIEKIIDNNGELIANKNKMRFKKGSVDISSLLEQIGGKDNG